MDVCVLTDLTTIPDADLTSERQDRARLIHARLVILHQKLQLDALNRTTMLTRSSLATSPHVQLRTVILATIYKE